jgi:predicted phosphodiesterase
MLEIQIVSDLHLEFLDEKKINIIKPAAPILALLGDICCCAEDADFEKFKTFILKLVPLYEMIIMVPGNHEYYYNKRSPSLDITIDSIDKKIKQFFKTSSSKLHLLNNNSIKITIEDKSYIIIGTTLWSWIPVEQYKLIHSSMNDYSSIYIVDKTISSDEKKMIRRILPKDISFLHMKSYRYIKSQITKNKNSKIIVLTHHKPYLSEYHDSKSLDVAYESDLSAFMNYVDFWAYGHTHKPDNRTIGKTWIYSNPKGYPGQKIKFDPISRIKLS